MSVEGSSDFLRIARELQEDKKYLELAAKLKSENKLRIIHDRECQLPYIERYYHLNFRPFSRTVLHRILRSDIDGLHDHPWPFQTFILSGGYWEHTQEGKFWRAPGYYAERGANFYHRLELDSEKAGEETWTLFLMGPKEKDWGFLNAEGNWVQWEEYIKDKIARLT